MRIAFILGNGFDIGLGLKTRFEDFYKKYCEVLEEDNDNIRDFKETLIRWQQKKSNINNGKQLIDWADFEKAFGEHAKEFSIGDKNKYLERFLDFTRKLNIYLENEQVLLDYDSNEKRISEMMFTAVNSYFNIREEDKQYIKSYYNSRKEGRSYSFLSFNYTNSVDTCARLLSRRLSNTSSHTTLAVKDKIHIHGYIEKDMIVGVDNPSQISNPDLALDEEVIKTLVKPCQNKELRSNYEKRAKEIIDESDIICIYGMSLGSTDKSWWQYIGKWLCEKDNRLLVVLKYDSKYNERFPGPKLKFYEDVYNDFFSLSDLTEKEIDQIRLRVFVGMNNNVFELNIRKDEKTDTSNIKQAS